MLQVVPSRQMRSLIFAAALTAASGPGACLAQTAYPVKPVRVVVSNPPGAATDIVARLLGERLAANTGQQFLTDNRPGAAGAIGVNFVARAPADGYTLLLEATGSLVIRPNFQPEQTVSTLKDFEHVAMLSSYAQFITTSPVMNVTDIKGLVAKVKREPGRHSYGHPGVGLTQHIALAAFVDTTGMDMVAVPYQGAALVIRDVVAGRATLGMGSVSAIKPLVEAGKLRPLAVLSVRRIAQMPDVPTIAEAGFPEFMKLASWLSWNAMLAPAGTPKDIVTRLNGQINEALRDAQVARRLGELGQDSMAGSTPDSTRQFIVSEVAGWGGVIRRLGIKGE